jgi:hypothetical protein
MTQEFSGLQKIFLAKLLTAKTEKEAAKETGIDHRTVRRWKQGPEFEKAVELAKSRKVLAIAEAQEEALRIVAAVTPTAARELAELIEKPWEEMSDRLGATKLRAIERALAILGVERPPSSTGRFYTPEGQVDALAIIMEIHGEKREETTPPIEGEFKELKEENDVTEQ